MGALALLVLAAGLCCLGLEPGAMDDHAVQMDPCFLIVLVLSLILLPAGLVPRGFVVSLERPILAAVPLAVPKPPPRRLRFA